MLGGATSGLSVGAIPNPPRALPSTGRGAGRLLVSFEAALLPNLKDERLCGVVGNASEHLIRAEQARERQ